MWHGGVGVVHPGRFETSLGDLRLSTIKLLAVRDAYISLRFGCPLFHSVVGTPHHSSIDPPCDSYSVRSTYAECAQRVSHTYRCVPLCVGRRYSSVRAEIDFPRGTWSVAASARCATFGYYRSRWYHPCETQPGRRQPESSLRLVVVEL